MIIDIHAHLWAEHHKKDEDTILKVLEQYNVDRIYISTLSELYPSKEQVTAYNNLTVNFMKKDHRIGGYIYCDPIHDNCIDVLKKGIANGMAAVKIWVSCYCDDVRVNQVAEFCITHNLPLLVHSFKKTLGQLPYETTAINVRNLALRYPDLSIIMAHLGGNCYDGIRCIADIENIYTDFSGTLYRADDIDYTVEQIGSKRVLYGTDLPTGCVQCLGQVEGANLSDAQKEDIYYRNAVRLFGDIK